MKIDTYKEFVQECKKITDKIREINEFSIVDGVINPEKYFNLPNNLPKSKPRILWILKEANSNTVWEYQNLLSIKELSKSKNYNIQTIRRVLYTSYGILNDFTVYAELPAVTDERVYGIAEQIAYINVNKDSGGSGTADIKRLEENSLKYRGILKQQIDLYNPDIIILGNTKKYLYEVEFDESIKTYSDSNTHNTALFEQDERLYIHAYHPGVRSNIINESVYCNEIIDAAKKWWLKRNK